MLLHPPPPLIAGIIAAASAAAGALGQPPSDPPTGAPADQTSALPPDSSCKLRSTGEAGFTFYPSHNEYDPNFGVPNSQRITARYSLESDITFHYGDCPLFFRLYDQLLLGRSLPQTDYSYAADPILIELQPALGYDIAKNLDARITYDHRIDLGGFVSHNEVTPWLALSLRLKTDEPLNLANAATLAAYFEGLIYLPGFEYPASPGASPEGTPPSGFNRDQIVNARYGLGTGLRVQPTAPILDRFFAFGETLLLFGDATLTDHTSWSASPISMNVEFGFGFHITPWMDLRFTHGLILALRSDPSIDRRFWSGLSINFTW